MGGRQGDCLEYYDSRCGKTVALSSDGTRMAIGSPGDKNSFYVPGNVRVYDWTGRQWTQVGSNLYGIARRDGFGTSVALSSDGTRVAIGAPYHGDNIQETGHVRVYDWTGSQWAKMGSDLYGDVVRGHFGQSVALSSEGTRMVIGAPSCTYQCIGDFIPLGYVRMYNWTGVHWAQVGSNLYGEWNGDGTGDGIGSSVALSSDGTLVAIGIPVYYFASVVRVYDVTRSQWTQVGSDLVGRAEWSSVALSSDGTRVAIGSPGYESHGDMSGRVRVYDWTGSLWMQVGSDVAAKVANDCFGCSLALSSDGTRMAIGVPGTYFPLGYVRLYHWTGRHWKQVAYDLIGDPNNGDQFGSSVALSSDGTRVAIGQPSIEGRDSRVVVYDALRLLRFGASGFRLIGEPDNSALFGSSVALLSDGTRVANGQPPSIEEKGNRVVV